jgi:S1-C subfamily serine protease
MDQEPDKIVVAEVIDGSPAKKGGLQKNDVVLKVNGVEVNELKPTIDLVRQAKPGQEIVFQVKRDGKEKDVKIKAGVLPWKWLMQLE